MNYAGWLLDAGTAHERAIAGAGYAPSMGGMTAEPLVLRSDALVEIERLRAALAEYANPLNWNGDSAGMRRVWLEPGSTTPEVYNGFEAARAALKA